MNDDRLDEIIREVVEGHNPPPPAPREAIWNAVAARRSRSRGISRDFNRRFIPLIAAAALLVIGVGLGRWSMQPKSPPVPEMADLEEAAASPRSDQVYKVAASWYLGRTEMLLTQFRSGSEGEEDLAPRARELLGELRLFLDSPAARDPDLRRLLLDLEVVLARIVHDPDVRERDDIRASLEERAIMMRIRNRVPIGL